MGQPQLQIGHFYLVHDGEGHGEIRPYMHDGWYPAEPHPAGLLCEMSRTHHPDNVDMPDEFEIAEWELAFIAHHYPPVTDEPLIAQGIRGLAQAVYQANTGEEWDWTVDDYDKLKKQFEFLIIGAYLVKDVGGDNPAIQDINDIIAAKGMPLGIFRARHWPLELQPGATPLPYADGVATEDAKLRSGAGDAQVEVRSAPSGGDAALQAAMKQIGKSLGALEQHSVDESTGRADGDAFLEHLDSLDTGDSG